YITNYIMPPRFLQAQYAPLYRLLALLLVLLAMYLVGLLLRNIIGRSLYRLGDRVLTRIPVIKTIYVAIRQISESILNSRRTLFKQVVAVEFPRKGVYSLGFITASAAEILTAKLPGADGQWQDAVCILVPTAPNPTTGFFMMVPRDDLVPLDISVPDAMKLIISAGAVFPGQADLVGRTLLDRLEEWLHPPHEAPPQ
ncbi:MAG: DUF502 domain-containing protein, partial [Kiritimatiellia bacterium]